MFRIMFFWFGFVCDEWLNGSIARWFSMAGTKYKKYFDEMFEAHRKEFMEFMVLNQCYRDDKRQFKSRFDEEGAKIHVIVKEWEDRLCGQMERGKNASYSAKLGEKFQGEVVKYFPYYNEIGVKISFGA